MAPLAPTTRTTQSFTAKTIDTADIGVCLGDTGFLRVSNFEPHLHLNLMSPAHLWHSQHCLVRLASC